MHEYFILRVNVMRNTGNLRYKWKVKYVPREKFNINLNYTAYCLSLKMKR